ncbi:hypothetical protein [Microcoleus sp. N9_B4]|uniref:hypothetical protein n=1 Tax=Microcoleus sp. N9_B4 TaxID=3055386 RepID=UPI002FD36B17
MRSHGYEKIDHSEVLPGLDINLLSRCLLMASRVEAVKEFRRGISAVYRKSGLGDRSRIYQYIVRIQD